MKIFYSWQSDKSIPNNLNRSFIEKALENAVKAISRDDSIKVIPVIDRDTRGVAGTPSIPQTILQKIDESDIFVCDVTIINSGSKFRLTPNPNVLFELGYALKKFGWERVIMVMNEEFGGIDKLPFDLEKRRAVLYRLETNTIDKSAVRNALEKRLETNIRSIIEKENIKTDISKEENSTNNFLHKAKKLAQEVQQNEFRRQWYNSEQAINDIISSTNQIFSLIDQNFLSNTETFSHIGLKLHKDKFLRSIQTARLGSQIQLEGIRQDYISSTVQDLNLFLVLYKKIPLPQNSELFTFEPITKHYFAPDINFDKQVIWRDKNDVKNYAAREICDRCFELLINQITNKGKLDETVEGGRYIVDGRLVDAFGNPI